MEDPLTPEQSERLRQIAREDRLQRKATREGLRLRLQVTRAQLLVLQGLRDVAVAIKAEPHHPRTAELMQQAKPLLQALPPGPDTDEVRERFERLELTTLRNLVDPPTPDG